MDIQFFFLSDSDNQELPVWLKKIKYQCLITNLFSLAKRSNLAGNKKNTFLCYVYKYSNYAKNSD
jgi:hypothetical protein